MAFAPAIPFGGLLGFRFIERTYDAQFETFGKSPDIQRDVDYFLENAGAASTAEALVADRRLLRVALGAFGLDEEIDKRAFIRKILEEGTLDPKALANRLADPAWTEVTEALGYGDLGGLLIFGNVREDIAERYRLRQFERAIGDSDVDIRLALNFRRQIREIATEPGVDQSGWFKVLGSQPLRRVFEGAYNLPTGFGLLDIDRQRDEISARTGQMFGSESPDVFATDQNIDDMLRRFLVSSQLRNGISPSAPGATALTLLQNSGLGAAGSANLFASNF
jgi:Protein of unknown function (DUF1217)